MKRHRKPSRQAIKVLRGLLERPNDWRYGYDMIKEDGLQSGTLYPLLMRFTDMGVLESEWHSPAQEGRPARHAYRLTQKGLIYARTSIEAIPQVSGKSGLVPT